MFRPAEELIGFLEKAEPEAAAVIEADEPVVILCDHCSQSAAMEERSGELSREMD
jgi:hypothetical protein